MREAAVATDAPVDRGAPSDYTALIRTRDSFPLVEDAIRRLRLQSAPPARIVVVDSGSSPEQRRRLDALVDEVIDYPDEPFNYSKAINLGIAACRSARVLIVSSHVLLDEVGAIERATREASAIGAIGFYFWTDATSDWRAEPVDRDNFDGHNGLHNTCAMLRTADVAARPFRPEVFSAEDQEWAAHQFRTRPVSILRIGTRAMRNLNPRVNHLKFVNEEVSIAYFTCRERLGIVHLLSWLARSALAFVRGRRGRARAHLKIFVELVLARVRPPRRTSSYY